MRVRRLVRFLTATQVFLLLASLLLPALASAATIQTDLWVYQNGDTVTVTGAGFGPNEVVDFITSDPNGTVVDDSAASATSPNSDDSGNVTYAFTLHATVDGIYDVTGTGETSALSAATQFDPGSVTLGSPIATPFRNTPQPTGGSGFDVTVGGTYSCSNPCNTNAGNAITVAITGLAGTTQTVAATAGSGSWSAQYQFRTSPGAGQLAVPADGSYTATASFAFSGSGSPKTDSSTGYFKVDNTAPTVTMADGGNPTNANPIHVTVTFSESVTGFTIGDITVGNGSAGNLTGSGTSYAFDLTPSGQGVVTADIAAGAAADAAGNGNSAAPQFSRTFDSISPTVLLAWGVTSPTNTSPIHVTATFSEAVTGFVAGDLSLTNAAASNFSGSGASYSFDLTPSGQGMTGVRVDASKANDLAGNPNTASNALSAVFDSVNPTVTMADGGNPTNANPIHVTVTFSESVTGFTIGDITVGNGSAGNLTGSGTSYAFDLTPSGQGVVTADIAAGAAADAAGNGNSAAPQFSRTFDSISPTCHHDVGCRGSRLGRNQCNRHLQRERYRLHEL